MSALAPFALIALLPAALGTTPPDGAMLTMPVCNGDGQVRTVEIPLDQPGRNQAPCTAKGCHGGASRKKSGRYQ